MKKSLKCLSVILVMLITLFSFSITALAQTTTQDGLQVSLATDKQSYSLNEDIEITVSVTNTNDFTVEDVSIEALLPDNFELKDSKQNTSAKAVDLKAGENVTLKLTALVKEEEQSATNPTEKPTDPTKPSEPITNPSEPVTKPDDTTNPTKPVEITTQNNSTSKTETTTKVNAPLNVKETTTNKNGKSESTTVKTKSADTKNGKSPYTGVDYTLLAIFFVIFFFSICGLLYCLLVHTKKTKKAISSVLCLVIAVTSVIGFTSYKAYADDREFSTITISEQIKVDNKDYTISANVKYQVGGINLTIDNKENTVTDFNQILSGTFSSTSNVVSVTYIITTEIDDYEITDSGNANINDNRYSADIQLKPENNKITVTATTDSGKIESKTVNVKYDSGKLYKTDKRHISYDSETKKRYINNIVLVYFNEGVSDERRNKIVSSINGKVVGTLNGVNQWQVEVATTDLKGLKEICSNLEKIDDVYGAFVNEFVKVSPDVIVNDPWKNANGGDWYLRTIDAYPAWEYNNRFNEINIGIVDNGFDTEHEDLKGKIVFPNKICQQNNSLEQHGTHVAGIIGAQANNEIGITGLLWKSKLYCVDWQPTDSQNWTEDKTINEVLSGLTYTVEAGAKVVNYSLGMTSSQTYKECIDNSFETYSTHTSKVMVELLNKNKDFIVVQSAGNGTSDGYAVDAKYNGFFCAITNNDITIPKNSKLSKQDILDRIIVVGNAQLNSDGTYMQHISSNGGNIVDICAPGTDIFSTVPGGDNGSYANLTGTSMAAPVVTAVCGMVWSIDNGFTGIQVKNIVCNSYDENIWVYDNTNDRHTTKNNYRMVNAKLSVEKAIENIGFGNIAGCVKEATDKAPIKDVEVRALDEKGTVIEKTKTDENGNFTLSLPAGKYTLNIGGELGATTEYSYETYTTDVTVDSNVWTVLKDDILLNRATMRITGNIYDSESKETLADVEVKAYRVVNGTSEYVSSGTSNANGEYVINISKNGTYNLEFTKSGYTTTTQNSVMTFGNLTYAEWQYLVKDNTGGDNVFAGGDGTEANPYQVSTPEQLNAVRNDLSAHYIQINDIDMSNWGNWETIGNAISIWSGAIGGPDYHAPVYTDNYFTGVYDGNNHKISNLSLLNSDVSVTEDCFGLFAGLKNATVKNLILNNIVYNIDKETTDYTSYWTNQECTFSLSVGGIAGRCDTSTISNCSVSGKIYAINCSDAYVGGIAGIGNTISHSNSNVEIYINANKDGRSEKDARVSCGGIVGRTTTINSKILHCFNNGNINVIAVAGASCGGISGEYGYITNCFNYGNISGIVTNSLGVANNGPFNYQMGNSVVGGIVGSTSSDDTAHCINYGNVMAKSTSVGKTKNPFGNKNKSYAGGIVGICGYDTGGSISNNYNYNSSIESIAISSENTNIPSYAYSGRIAGYSRKTSDCYSIYLTTINGSIPTENIAPNKINGGSLTKEEMDEKIKDLI